MFICIAESLCCTPRTNAFELWCWRRLLRVPWTARRSNQSILKEISSGCSLEGLMLKLKLQYFTSVSPDVKSWLIWKDPDAEKDWGQEEKGTTEDEMFRWHHWLNGHGFGWTLGVGDGQGGLVCCGSWGHRESDTTEQLNWTKVWNIQALFQAQNDFRHNNPRVPALMGTGFSTESCLFLTSSFICGNIISFFTSDLKSSENNLIAVLLQLRIDHC